MAVCNGRWLVELLLFALGRLFSALGRVMRLAGSRVSPAEDAPPANLVLLNADHSKHPSFVASEKTPVSPSSKHIVTTRTPRNPSHNSHCYGLSIAESNTPRARLARGSKPSKWLVYLAFGCPASRCYGTVTGAGTDTQSSRGDPEPPWRPKQHRAATSGIVEPAIIRKGDGQPLYVPSVKLSPEASKSPSVHKIHILGEDARSKFIAHALSGVYASVERLAWTRPSNKYRYLQRFDKDGTATFEPLNVGRQKLASREDTHIDELVVSSESAQGALEALDAVKHRVDNDTTVCLMTEGLGVLDDVRQKIFAVPEKEPTFLLGNMSSKFVFNRNFDSVRQLRHGVWNITSVQRSAVMSTTEQPKIETQTNFVRSLQAAKLLHTEYTPFDSWFLYKLPGVIFDSAVEPVCLLLDVPYAGLLQNASARKLISSLLEEIVSVLRLMPEVGRGETLHELLDVDRAKKALYRRILHHRSRESRLVRDIRMGHPVNVDYLNGYFLRRAHALGVKVPTNKMMWDLVKAKNAVQAQERESYIRIEETSVTPEMEDQHTSRSSY